MIVLDASAGIELLRRSPAGDRVADALNDRLQTIHVPALFAVEVTQVLRRLVAGGSLDEDRAEQALDDLIDLDLVRHEHEPYLERVWSLRHSMTAYDGVYVALAETIGAPLQTMDGSLARAAGALIQVDLLS